MARLWDRLLRWLTDIDLDDPETLRGIHHSIAVAHRKYRRENPE